MSRSIRKTRASNVLCVVRGVGIVGVVSGGLAGGSVGRNVNASTAPVSPEMISLLYHTLGLTAVGGVVVAVCSLVLRFMSGEVIRPLRGGHAPVRVRMFSAPTSLRLVRGLLPGDEGAAWWAEVNSCLAETVDPDERRRYVSGYRRKVPQLIWTSWAEHLSASDRRELS